ncbi:hypothetical protein l11_13890 [Neisseria weaveri LMG 5135]|nr:hypothetical protein l11_13890 [Neisseria weaveri LMG 5135]
MLAGKIDLIGIGLVYQAAVVERLGQNNVYGYFFRNTVGALVLAVGQYEVLGRRMAACGEQ